MKHFAAAAIVLATVAASPTPSPMAGRSASVVCERTPLYLWQRGQSLPVRTGRTNDAELGQRFTIVSGPRATPDSRPFFELDIPVTEPGYGTGAHYWISLNCVSAGAAPVPSASP